MKTFLLLLVILYFPTLSLASHDADIERQLQQITTQNFSPFCAGRILSDCPSGATMQLKDDIREKLRAGMSIDEINEHLYLLYGEEIRAMPRMQGVEALAWLLPLAFLFVGFAAFTLWLRYNTGREDDEENTTQGTSNEQ